MTQLIPIAPDNIPALQFIEPIYIQSFPIDERRPFDHVAQLLRDNPIFHLTLLVDNELPVGFISYWQWDDFTYIEHFAVDSTRRGAGYGANGLKTLLEQLQCPVILEVEPPVDEWSCRRVGFYQRIGFELYRQPYTQPPYSPNQQSVSLLLMSYGPIELAHCFDTVVERLHHQVYGVE